MILNAIVALAPYVLQLLAMVPGFAKTIAQFKADISGHPNLTADQKVQALRDAKAEVAAADAEVQAAVAADLPEPKPTAPG